MCALIRVWSRLLAEPSAQARRQGRWLVQLDEMSGALDQLGPCPGNSCAQAMSTVDRDPRVLLPPDHQRWNVHLGVSGLHLVGVALVRLSDLTIEGSLSLSATQQGETSISIAPGDRPTWLAPAM